MKSGCRALWAGLLATGWLLVGCNPVSISDANEAEIRVGAQDGVEVSVVTSTNFFLEGDESFSVNLIEADTVTGPPPVSGTYDIRDTRRFYVEVLDAEPEGAVVRLQVWIDGSEARDTAISLTEGRLRYIFHSRTF
jgi:hypothetical protein